MISPHDRDEAKRLLGAEAEWIPNGVDTGLFDREELGHDERLARWREWLVEDPRGWDESGEPGSIRYSEEDIEALADPDAPVLLFVGRFLDFKRVPLLVRAYAAARERFDRRAPLVIWGGFPGEWEGEHPHTVAHWLRVPDVFFAGWRGHADLARGLPCCDVMVAPSENEPFGQVFLEAMAVRRAGDRHPQRRAAVVREHRGGRAERLDGGRGRRGRAGRRDGGGGERHRRAARALRQRLRADPGELLVDRPGPALHPTGLAAPAQLARSSPHPPAGAQLARESGSSVDAPAGRWSPAGRGGTNAPAARALCSTVRRPPLSRRRGSLTRSRARADDRRAAIAK